MHPLNPAPLLDKKSPATNNRTIKNKKTFLNFNDEKPTSILKNSESTGNIDDRHDNDNPGDVELMNKLYTQNNENINKTIFNTDRTGSDSQHIDAQFISPQPQIRKDNMNTNVNTNMITNTNGDVPIKYSYSDNYPRELPSTEFRPYPQPEPEPRTDKVLMENGELLGKLDYLINLLEEQKAQKTTYIAEELILYTFLGIFIIFVLDNFTKFASTVAPAKYTR